MDVNTKLQPDQEKLLEDAGRYRRLVGKLPDSDQIRHNIYSQRSESVFVGTDDYPLGGSNGIFVVNEESSRRGLLYLD